MQFALHLFVHCMYACLDMYACMYAYIYICKFTHIISL